MTRLQTIIETAIDPALALLPPTMDSKQARVLLLAIGLQESKFVDRWQVIDRKRPQVKGPARGFWQFELGSQASRGGVWGVFLHSASRFWLSKLCEARDVAFAPRAIWLAIEQDDVLAAGLARLLLFTDPKRLPALGEEKAAWNLYRVSTWRPGKPHVQTWPENYAQAMRAVGR